MDEKTLKTAEAIANKPKRKATVAELTELAETRVNGNITDFKNGVKELHPSDCILLIDVLEEWGHDAQEAKTIVYAALL